MLCYINWFHNELLYLPAIIYREAEYPSYGHRYVCSNTLLMAFVLFKYITKWVKGFQGSDRNPPWWIGLTISCSLILVKYVVVLRGKLEGY
jgi:hypothetical protein